MTVTNSKTSAELYAEAMKRIVLPTPAAPLSRFPKLQKITGGLRPNEFTILCGSTGSGKTTLAANLSASLIDDGVKQFVASVETGPIDYINRVMSVYAGQDLNTGDPISADVAKHFHINFKDKIQNGTMFVSLYEDRFSCKTLMDDIRHQVETNGVQVAIVDNLNFFLDVTSAKEQYVEMDRVTHELIIFVKQVPVHIIMIMHPRKGQFGVRVNSEYDVKGSSTAIQEAHNIFLWNRPHEDLIKHGQATDQDRELFIAKMRRRGKYIGKKLMFSSKEGVQYQEGWMF